MQIRKGSWTARRTQAIKAAWRKASKVWYHTNVAFRESKKAKSKAKSKAEYEANPEAKKARSKAEYEANPKGQEGQF